MKHPILEGSGYKLYALTWAIVSVVHVLVLNQYYEFSLTVSILDSIVHNLLFAAISPGFWYLVKHSNHNRGDIINLFGTHAVAALLTVTFWLYLSKFILTFLIVNEADYISFLQTTLLWRAILGLLFYSIIVLVYYLIHYYLDQQDRNNRELELRSLLSESELKMLKSQINPHFIFNSLNSISALTMSKPEKAQEMVIKLSDFLRYSIGKGSSEMNPLSEEIQNVQLYLDIEKVRFGDKLNFESKVSEPCGEVMVPNLILQPLFENAIKYGVNESIEAVSIGLECKLSDGMLNIRISNNFDPNGIPKKGEGIGLDNIRKRLTLVYHRNDLLQIEKQENEFKVVLKIPVKQI
ncbi:MAG: two-component system LytT family sensor kinase [Bacteroidia bacterium]